MATQKFLALLEIEEVRGSLEEPYNSDSKRRYLINAGWMVEGEMWITSRPSELEANLKRFFKTPDPFMKQSNGMVPTGSNRSFYTGSTSTSSITPAAPVVNKNGEIRRVFLTRDPIYKEPEGSIADLVLDISKTVTGETPGAATGLIGELLDEIISPRKRNLL